MGAVRAMAASAAILCAAAGVARGEVQGVSATEIVLGSHQDLSGPINFYGVPMKNGLEMAAEEINAAGGINGRKIRLVIEDSGYDPKKAVLATQKLLDHDRIFAMIASLGTPTSGATMPLVLKRGLPHLFPMTPADMFFTPHDPLKFGYFSPYYDTMRVTVRYVLEQGGYKRVGLLYQDDSYGEIVKAGVVDELAALGLTPVSQTTYKRGATDFATQIARLKADGADLVALGTVIRETVGAVKAARAIGWDVPFVVSGAGYEQSVIQLGGADVEGLYAAAQTPIPYPDTASPAVKEWIARYEKRFGVPATLAAAYTYDALHLFAEGARRAGPDLTPESLVAGFEQIKDYRDIFGGPPVSFSAGNHKPRTGCTVVQVQNGRWVLISPLLGS
ncbi:MAG: ABC transporter substrate-binding protein [Alphaproteobacteria bacterium]|nr:ABC transporter substrate-binding protein [Alphaproteobacteria bacterium]